MRMPRWTVASVSLIGFIALVTLAIAFLRPPAPSEPVADAEWTCSMHPQIKLPRAGRCPLCGMDLIPVAQVTKEKARVDSRAGVYVEPIALRELFKEIRTVGKIDYSERQVAYITTRITGRVHRVFADFPGMEVRKDTHLLEIFSPDLLVTLHGLANSVQSGDREAAESARARLRAKGILDEQIKEFETSKDVKPYITIHAPMGGAVIEKNVRIGQYVNEGDVLYRIANLDPVWLYLDIYEFDLSWIAPGQAVEALVEAFPGTVFHGKVTFIDPFLDDKTRAVRARVNLPNPERKLRPGMYASATIRVRLRADGLAEPTGLEGKHVCFMHPEVIRDGPGKCSICNMPLERVPERKPPPATASCHADHLPRAGVSQAKVEPGKVLAIPAGAVLDTGRRKVAYRQNQTGAYELVELVLGPRADGRDDRGNPASFFAVQRGLQEGDRVVVRGAFLIDSQRQIEGMPSLLYPEGQSAVNLHAGHETTSPGKAPAGATHKH